MAKFRGERTAFGHPGMPPRWTHGGKDGVGTAYASSSRIWFTIWNGILTEVYYPTIDRPQIRDLQFLITDGRSFLHEEKRHLQTTVERPWANALAYRIINSDPEGRYRVEKRILADPRLSCILQSTRVKTGRTKRSDLRLYALCAPHINVGGWGNNGYVVEADGRQILVAEKRGTWLALGATLPFRRASCGFVGQSDGWTDLNDNWQMDWEFDRAIDGNIALIGELVPEGSDEFTLGLALGDSLQNALSSLFQGLGIPFQEQFDRYVEQWKRPRQKTLPLEKASESGGNLYQTSVSLLVAHEDKDFPGAFIASLSIPWGEAKGDEDRGGYHLVWTRDMVHSATALLASGHTITPLRALIYLATSQENDGGFPQNFWIDGQPYFSARQLDEVAFPILLAWRLSNANVLFQFDPYEMIMCAARYLILNGPATEQERWEEAAGYSPSTLASSIAALFCASDFASRRGDTEAARFILDYADFLESHVEDWTVTTEGTLISGIKRHYIRIHPVNLNDPRPNENPNTGTLTLANAPPEGPWAVPAKDVVDAGFLELVRYGIRRPDDPIIVDSLKVVDAVLKVTTPFGPCWRRYNRDGYGQRDDGTGYDYWGRGRAWPLLTGERGHYELAAGGDPKPFLRAMEGFASPTGLLPEQVWDSPDYPEKFMFLGRPTGAAMPLMWAHAEYIKLLRSTNDGAVFDRIGGLANRYIGNRGSCQLLEIWKHNRQPRTVKKGFTLRIQCSKPFRLHWSDDEWVNAKDTDSTPTSLEIYYVDLPISQVRLAPIRFTFQWPKEGRWEGLDYSVAVE